MKFYVAGRTNRIAEIKELISQLEGLGHECTHDWTRVDNADLQRPYHNHIEIVQTFAVADIHGAVASECFIIFADKEGTGMYVEMGAALASGAKVYAIGKYNDQTVFHFHPLVSRVDSAQALLKVL